MSSGTGTLAHRFWLLSFPRNGYSSKVPWSRSSQILCPSKFNFALCSSALLFHLIGCHWSEIKSNGFAVKFVL